MMSRRFATDMELLAVQGDTTTSGSTPIAVLLAANQGWGVLTEDSHIIDAGGAQISPAIWEKAFRAMPDQHVMNPNLKWFYNTNTAIDWRATLNARATGLGDLSIAGENTPPLGIAPMVVPYIPQNLAVPVTTATSATVTGTRQGPFTFTTTNYLLKLDVDNAGAVSVDMGASAASVVLNAPQVCKLINDQYVAGFGATYQYVASTNGFGAIVLTSPTTGATSEIDIQASATNVYTILGLTIAAVTGAAAGANSLNEGTFIWLADPMNFIYGILGSTRVLSEYNKDYDRVEVVMYNDVDFAVENNDAIVKVKRLRKKVL